MQVAHPIIAPTIDNNGIYSIVIDNNRTRADSRIYSGISSQPNGIDTNRTRTDNKDGISSKTNGIDMNRTRTGNNDGISSKTNGINNNRTRTGNIKNMVLVQKPMELIIIELELVTIEIMVLVQKSWQILTSF